MSTIATFDTLLYAKKLREAGLNEAQAELQAEALKSFSDQHSEALQTSLAHHTITNQDILLLKTEMDKLKTEMRIGFKSLKLEMHTADDSMKWKLNTILGLLTLFGTLTTLAQFLQ